MALELVRFMEDEGAEAPSFPPIVAAGAHGARPHAEPRDVVQGEEFATTGHGSPVIAWGSMDPAQSPPTLLTVRSP